MFRVNNRNTRTTLHVPFIYSKTIVFTFNVPCISESCIKIKINLNFYFHPSFLVPRKVSWRPLRIKWMSLFCFLYSYDPIKKHSRTQNSVTLENPVSLSDKQNFLKRENGCYKEKRFPYLLFRKSQNSHNL